MPALDTGPGDLRKAALTLHALASEDRQWLLDRLSSPQRAQLAPLLAELQQLGWPADIALVRAALVQVGSAPDRHDRPQYAAFLAEFLAQEPAPVQTVALRALETPLRQAVLAAWPAQAPRPRLEPNTDGASALTQAFAQALRQQLKAAWTAQQARGGTEIE